VNYEPLESILIVFQNPAEGRLKEYDDWYTHIHIRDAMRLDGAIATQRFVASRDQPVLGGKRVNPGYFAHTIYEWESAAKSVMGHSTRAGTPSMEITRDCSFVGLRDYFYRPVFLSHGWSPERGFRRGDDVLTALIVPRAHEPSGFINWFCTHHVADTLALPGFGSVGLFSLHEEQSLPLPSRFPLVAIYALSDRTAALRAWAERHDAGFDADLSARSQEVEVGCWQPRIPRLRAIEVAHPDPAAVAEERRARAAYGDRFLTQSELQNLLTTIRA
jgi:hypothetical protein